MNLKSFYRTFPIFSTLLLMIILSFAFVCIAIKATNIITLHGKEYETPDFVGKSIETLNNSSWEKDSNNHDFNIFIIDSVFAPEQQGGIVLAQDPVAGNKIKKGRNIYLTITTYNPPETEMPNLLDLSLRQAENMLESNNLKLGQIIYKASKYNNAVLEQRYRGKIIHPGTKLPYMSEITLIVGKELQEQEEYFED